ncbi:hypothetical protein [Pedobacter ginsengisoli]|uniref:hypothetical protein n=1 Tax=Pedobacter ginsengisoli TaxID=363852 RepID=UPI00254EEECA|nr:hypothetical protein [Pedobacter ginsengisoli]
MKRNCVLLGFLMLSNFAFSQTNVLNTTGNVGIGTLSPSEKLEVSGNILISGSSNPFIQIAGGTSGTGGYFQGSKQAGSAAGYGAWVNHNAYWDGTNFIQPRGTLSSSLFSSNFHLGFIWQYAAAGGVNGAIIQPVERMRLNASGRLGLGTGSIISAKFHIVDAAQQLRLGYDDANYNAFTIGSNGSLTIASYGTNPNVSILNANVGIGTSLPSEKLSVKGKIRAQEVKVEMANWSDFVFANDYVLPSLQETEKHIKEKGHLPGIPSAAEVEKNGIELGDMNKKLLQKIEELTLYLIEKDKKIQAMEQRINKIEQNHK